MEEKIKELLRFYRSYLDGQFLEISDRNSLFQCMDAAYLWTFLLRYPKATIQHLYASEVWTKATALTRQYFDLLPNTPTFVPRAGDIGVFSNKVTIGGKLVDVGHIGMCLDGATIKVLPFLSQNYPTGDKLGVDNFNYNKPKLLGVLRPKVLA